MSILVTGAAGFIGSHVTEALLEQGHEVVGLDNFDRFYARDVKERNLQVARSHDGFRLIEADIAEEGALDGIPDTVDSIIHLAALAGVRPSIAEPERYWRVNVMGTSALVSLAKQRGIGTFAFASSSSVYGNNEKVPFAEGDRVDHPISPYAATKKSGELLCHTASHLDGLTTLCLRFFTVYGPRQRPDLAIHKFARLIRDGREIPMFGDGSSSRDYTYISDTVDGVLKGFEWARENEGAYEVVNLGESETITLSEMIRVIGETLGIEPDIRQLPMQPGDVDRTYADISKARSLFGYDPQVDFGEGIRRFIEWIRASGPEG